MLNSKDNIAILKLAFDEYSKQYGETLPSDDELAHLTFSEKFEQKMRRIIKAEKNRYYYLVNTLAKRIACFVLAIILSFTTVTFSVDALREPFVEFVVEVYEKFTSLFFSKDTTNQSSEKNFVFEPIEPTYIPEGYKLESREQTAFSLLCVYINKNGEKLYYRQKIGDSIEININTEKVDYQNIDINKIQAIYYYNKNVPTITFNTKGQTYSILGNTTKHELIKIAESIFF